MPVLKASKLATLLGDGRRRFCNQLSITAIGLTARQPGSAEYLALRRIDYARRDVFGAQILGNRFHINASGVHANMCI